MITISRLGYRGNLGNQFFQIASLISLAKKHQQEYCLPQWKYADYFDFEFNIGYADENFIAIKEQKFNYHDWNITNGNFDIDGYLQSEKYFDVSLVKKMFTFKSKYLETIKLENQHLFNKKTILISVRRGDYVYNPSFYQVDFKFYLLAIFENFPDWKERNLIFTSDSFSYCKFHFGFLKNAYFVEDLSIIQQFALGTQCDDYVISSSTFQWWMAWLGEKKTTKIVHPIKVFRGQCSQENNDKDFFPERWIAFDERNYKLSNEFLILKIRAFFYEINQFVTFQYITKVQSIKKWIKKVIKYKK